MAFFEILATTGLGAEVPIAPDWLLGAVLGVGGLVMTGVLLVVFGSCSYHSEPRARWLHPA